MTETGGRFRSAVWDIAMNKLSEAAGKSFADGLKDPKLVARCDDIEAKDVYGHDAVKDSRGQYVPQGIGARGRETANHFAAMLRYQGREVWEREVRAIWKRDPARARFCNLPEPPRAA